MKLILLSLFIAVFFSTAAFPANPSIIWGSGGYAENLAETGLKFKSGIELDDESTQLRLKSGLFIEGPLKAISTTDASSPCPSMTEAQRDLLSASFGDCVSNSTANALNFYDGTSWVAFGGSTDLQGAYSESGDGTVTVDGTNGALKVRDNVAPIGANLFEVLANNASELFEVALDAFTVSIPATFNDIVTTIADMTVGGDLTVTGDATVSGGYDVIHGANFIDDVKNLVPNAGRESPDLTGVTCTSTGDTAICGSGNRLTRIKPWDKREGNIDTLTSPSDVEFTYTLANADFDDAQMLMGMSVTAPANSDNVEIFALVDDEEQWRQKVPSDGVERDYYFPVVGGTTDYKIKVTADLVATSIKYDNIYIGEIPVGASPYKVANIGDWEEFPSTDAGTLITATGTNPTYGTVVNNKARWRRVGENMEIEWDFTQSSAGTNGSGAYLFNLPNDYEVDTSKLSVSSSTSASSSFQQSAVGTAYLYYGDGTAPSHGVGSIVPYNSSQFKVLLSFATTQDQSDARIWGGSSITDGGYPFSLSSEFSVSFRLSVPIQGWSSSTSTVVTQTQEETVKTANVLSADVASDGSVSNENHDFINGNCSVTSGVFNCPFNSGVFTVAPKVTGCVATNAAGTSVAVCEKGVLSKDNAQIITEAGSSRANLAYTIEFTKNAPDYNKTQVISGSFEAIKSDKLTKVEANKDGASQSIPHASGTVLTFPNEVKDTTNSFNNTAGVFTAKNSAAFNFDLMAWFDFASWSQGHIAYARAVHKRDAVVQKYYWIAFHIVPFTSASVEVQLDGDVTIDMLEGDTVEIELFQSSGASKSTKTGDGQNELVITEEPDAQSIVENLSDNPRLKTDQYSESEMKWGKWNGDQLYRRCFTVGTDITTSSDLTTWDSGLTPRGHINYYAVGDDRWVVSSIAGGTSYTIIYYNKTDGKLSSVLNGANWKIGAGTSFCMDYTK